MVKPAIDWDNNAIEYEGKLYKMLYEQQGRCKIGTHREDDETIIWFLSEKAIKGTNGDNCIVLNNELMNCLTRAVITDSKYWSEKAGILE